MRPFPPHIPLPNEFSQGFRGRRGGRANARLRLPASDRRGRGGIAAFVGGRGGGNGRDNEGGNGGDGGEGGDGDNVGGIEGRDQRL